ncbi:hypothetical protein [Halobacterium sp. CBA1126]|uniref:hypothetical protein n=1 Tax=Halobacterium TaxID=2239 RepID=UPI0012FC124E|nr:hypothetical protein [Halobacterium sp. CBA1126]MUV60709.1 hypothetical protein [Halobacterium sp. CBA1126]
MEAGAFVERWRSVISLALFSVVWASLQWDVLCGLVTEGFSAVETLSDAGMLVMLLLTLATTGYAVRQTLTEETEIS